MIIVRWTGKAASVNKWHVIRKGRICASRSYEQFIDALAWTITAETGGCRPWRRLDLRIHCTIWRMRDKQNLLKPICDAIERSGLIKNDRDIGHIHICPAEFHERDELDQIMLMLSEVK